MKDTYFDAYCALYCADCEYRKSANCGGCIATEGHPFHGECDVAKCAKAKGRRFCGECADFPCELLKLYSFDPEHGDNGERIENCKKIKRALVAEAREGNNPIAYCGFSCDGCFLGEWCGGCRSDYNCCSFATLYGDGVCPQVRCCKERGLNGCWECAELDGCEKGYFSVKNECFCKASALFIRQRGEQKYTRLLEGERERGVDLGKICNETGGAQAAFHLLLERAGSRDTA